VTTTPPLIVIPWRTSDQDLSTKTAQTETTQAKNSQTGAAQLDTQERVNEIVFDPSGLIGYCANAPSESTLAPVTIQVGLTASIPPAALAGTGITSIEIGTPFTQQDLGNGASFQSATSPTVLNLIASHPGLPPFTLATAQAGTNFTDGIYYVLSLTGSSLNVTGSDGSSSTGSVTNSDTVHTFVGAMVYNASVASVQLYPKLQLTLPPPPVGTYGVLQGEHYSVQFTYGDANSRYDIIDSNQAVVELNISVPNLIPTDGSKP
jgi:hypothetical protein